MTELSAGVREQLDQWKLRPDGTAVHGPGSLVLPVRTSDGATAALKVRFTAHDSEPGSQHEHLVLRRWAGDGAVRLLRADPHRRALLVERAHPQDLQTVTDIEACEVVAGLYRRLHVPALPQLPSLATSVEDWIREFAALPRGAPIPRRQVEQAITIGRDLTARPSSRGDGDRVLHGDLHYGNVLAADRQPWLAIAPKPVNGDPHYELAPMLLHRWDELAGHIRGGVRNRLYALVDAAGLDEDLARGWVLVRVVHQAVRELRNGPDADSAKLTRYVALAKAVQD